MQFGGRTAVVTGAGSGIGAALSRRLLEEGAWVLAADRDPSGAPEGVFRMQADVSDPISMEQVFATVAKERSGVDMVFNNAGIGSTKDLLDCSPEEWDRVFAVNCRGVFLGCKHAVKLMLDQTPTGGVIVNTASVAGLVGFPDRTAYCASKGAVIALTRQVALQYAESGIRCNCVCPGTIDSPWVRRLLEEAPDASQARAALVARQPLGRLGTPDEVAAAMCYLASDDAAFITGTGLVIDGGILSG